MSQRSLRREIIAYGTVSICAAAVFVAGAYALYRYLGLRQSVDFEGNRLATTGTKQADQILPGLLMPEEYGSVDLQLSRIRESEDLLSANLVRAPDPSLRAILACPQTVERTRLCARYWKSEIVSATEVGLPGNVLAYLVKHKKLGPPRADAIVLVSLATLFVGISLVFLGLVGSILVFIDRHVRRPLLNLNDSLSPVLDGDPSARLPEFSVSELRTLSGQVEQLVRKYEVRKAEAAVGELAAQVAHDIRSPLALLKLVAGRASGLAPDDQKMLEMVSERIGRIAASLLQRAAPPAHAASEPTFLLGLLERIRAEKAALHASARVTLRAESDAAAAFVAADPTELGRAVANLVENAVEAHAGAPADVALSLTRAGERVEIAVRDRGRGVPPEVLTRLGAKGVTVGKTGGHGLGLYHARCLAEAAGGRLRMDSRVGSGSTFALLLPAVPAPPWLSARPDGGTHGPLVAVDDDPAILAAWHRLYGERVRGAFPAYGPEVVTALEDPGAILIADNRIGADGSAGLDFIESRGLAARAVLATQDSGEAGVRARCASLGLRVFPKALLPWLAPQEHADEAASAYDLALIDDDELVRLTWSLKARERSMRIAVFASVDEFRAAGVPRRTPVYVDYRLGQADGAEAAERLHAWGFSDVSLTTGADRLPSLPACVRSVVGKDFPL